MRGSSCSQLGFMVCKIYFSGDPFLPWRKHQHFHRNLNDCCRYNPLSLTFVHYGCHKLGPKFLNRNEISILNIEVKKRISDSLAICFCFLSPSYLHASNKKKETHFKQLTYQWSAARDVSCMHGDDRLTFTEVTLKVSEMLFFFLFLSEILYWFVWDKSEKPDFLPNSGTFIFGA